MTFDINTGIGSVADLIKTVVTRVVKDPQQQAEIALQVEQLKQSGELAEMTNATDLFKAEVDDRKSARDRDTEVNISENAPFISKIITPVLAAGIVLLTFTLFGLVMFQNQIIDPSKKDIVIYVLGALTTVLSQVISYYFGSTSASTKRNDAMVDIIKNGT